MINLLYGCPMPTLAVLDAERTVLMKDHPGWRVWFVPNALDGTVTWCAQREPTIHADSSEELGRDMALADAELASEVTRQAAGGKIRRVRAVMCSGKFVGGAQRYSLLVTGAGMPGAGS